ncbi:MAG: zincin-like metallopeptidase domain-containing protein [Gemmatimonadota bacterium]|nr:zincin-like metallopeptidase domain-containing protein [Gemmatimonadota bacterium]
MNHDEYHRKFADAIIEQIKKGNAPWQKPWAPGERVMPTNVDTGRSYRGGNSLHLAAVQQELGYGDVRWGTYRQIQAQGGQVRKGERGTRILSFQDHKRISVTDESGKPRRDAEGKRVYRYEKLKAPFVRQYTVFNAEQADGLPERSNPTPEPLWKAHQQAEKVMEDAGVPMRHVAGDRAYYHMKRDEIVLPERGQFPSANHYYQTALHELGHSTGHPERMNRETLVEGIKSGFGSSDYAREELRAEISAMMTGERVGVGHDPSRGAAYVEAWVKSLEEDPREIRRAAADGQRISDYVLARHIERGQARESAGAAREPMAVAATRAPGLQRLQVTVPQIPTPRRGAGPSR